MSRKLEFREVDSAASAIRELTASKADAEAQVADCHAQLDSCKEKLASILAEPITATNKEYLKAAKKAWRASIKAYQSLALESAIKYVALAVRDHRCGPDGRRQACHYHSG